MELVISNSSGTRLDLKKVRKAAALMGKNRLLVSLSFVKRPVMARLNESFRKRKGPTDVLSFNMNEDNMLGDVIICPSVARANAARYGATLNEEIARLAVHGMLHLLGHGHGKKMFDLQDAFMRRIGYA